MAKRRALVSAEPAKDMENAGLPLEADLTVLDELAGYHLRRAYGVQKQRFTSVFGPLNIRPVQFSILALIYRNTTLKQSELRKALNIERANIVTLLAELENRNLVARLTAQADKRSRVLRLTPAGKKLTAKLIDLHSRLEGNLEESLGARERNQLLKLLRAFQQLDPAPVLGEEVQRT